MPWLRRTRHLAAGEPLEEPGGGLAVRSLLTGRTSRLSVPELGELLAFSAREWSWRTDALSLSLAERGLLVSDEPQEPFVGLRRRDEELSELGWHPAAAAFHLETSWDGVRAAVPGRDGSAAPRAPRSGSPPVAFPVRGGERVGLEPVAGGGELQGVLRARRTVRGFDERPVTAAELATVLGSVWGVQGTAPLARGDVGVRKTSPSGGALHPLEVYPIVRRAEGVAPGVYHYLAREHALERVAALEEPAVGALLERVTTGQWWFAEAAVCFVLTARFARSYWKYRRHAKTYRVLLLEAGHLSQTFYLVCTELGLGPFVTAMLDDGELARTLGLDLLQEAPLALCGCGQPAAAGSSLDPVFVAT